MENFEQNSDNVKTKSIYHLHLDGKRIALVSSVLAGVLIISFLLGMSFVKDDVTPNSNLSQIENSLPNENFAQMPNDDIIAGGDIDKLDRSDMDKISSIEDNSPILLDDKKTDSLNKNTIVKNETVDLVTGDDIAEVVPVAKKKSIAKKAVSKKSVAKTIKPKSKKRSKVKSYIGQKPSKKKQRVAKKIKKKKRSSHVVPVSYEHRSAKRSVKKSGVSYVVQVASYDRRSKATSELRKLKKMRYDGFVNRRVIDGKTFYRVRIGASLSKTQARKLLGNLQVMKRYEDSYMVRD